MTGRIANIWRRLFISLLFWGWLWESGAAPASHHRYPQGCVAAYLQLHPVAELLGD
jgi:hypothetical protein